MEPPVNLNDAFPEFNLEKLLIWMPPKGQSLDSIVGFAFPTSHISTVVCQVEDYGTRSL